MLFGTIILFGSIIQHEFSRHFLEVNIYSKFVKINLISPCSTPVNNTISKFLAFKYLSDGDKKFCFIVLPLALFFFLM